MRTMVKRGQQHSNVQGGGQICMWYHRGTYSMQPGGLGKFEVLGFIR